MMGAIVPPHCFTTKVGEQLQQAAASSSQVYESAAIRVAESAKLRSGKP